jgi:hypothetical protein
VKLFLDSSTIRCFHIEQSSEYVLPVCYCFQQVGSPPSEESIFHPKYKFAKALFLLRRRITKGVC